ncbi:hypothetical protein QAD02_009879, partial [Eretmocerus hayati]
QKSPIRLTTGTYTTMQSLSREIACFAIFSISIVTSAIVPPPWADPASNPCATQPRGWQLLYWPPDGKCYKIFQIGAPCPETMELGPSAVGSEFTAECRCPPGTAQSSRDAKCYPLFTRASCPEGEYFAPVPDAQSKSSKKQRWGKCREPEPCPEEDELFWPRENKCYKRRSKGPCPKGELLVIGEDGLSKCSCSAEGELGKYYSQSGCYEHFTKGPCLEPGHLFLPNRSCACNEDMPHYYPDTKMCYQIGGQGPCPLGHHFVLQDSNTTSRTPITRASCHCRPKNVLHSSGFCYRPYTQGPCSTGFMLSESATCELIPCKRGHLYFPQEGTCYRLGHQGPCDSGQVVVYDYSASLKLDGVTYNGVCGFKSSPKTSNTLHQFDLKNSTKLEKPVLDRCEDKRGWVRLGDTCHRLYTQGPCLQGEWLVAQRQPRHSKWLNDDDEDDEKLPRARCECRPGYLRSSGGSSELESNVLAQGSIRPRCLPPAVGLAKYLNEMLRTTPKTTR